MPLTQEEIDFLQAQYPGVDLSKLSQLGDTVSKTSGGKYGIPSTGNSGDGASRDPNLPPRSNYLNENEKLAQDIVKDAFQRYGYTPTQAEIDSLAVGYDPHLGAGLAQSFVANYVNAVKNQQNLMANDPTRQVLANERGFFNDTQAKAAGYAGKAEGYAQNLQDLSKQAPQLFGSLTPDQVDAYLAPLKTKFAQSDAALEGNIARRGIAGSSTEASVLGDLNNQFKENILSTGLNIGLTEQQQRENILSNLYGETLGASTNLYSLLPGSLQRQGALAGSEAAALTDASSYLTQYPNYALGAKESVLKGGSAITPPSSSSGNPYASLLLGTAGAVPGLVTSNPALATIGYGVGQTLGNLF